MALLLQPLDDHLKGKGSYMRTVKGIQAAIDEGKKLLIFTAACKSLLPGLSHFADDLFNDVPAIGYLTLIQLIPVEDGGFAPEELLEPEDLLKMGYR